jgi:hypothetical protein
MYVDLSCDNTPFGQKDLEFFFKYRAQVSHPKIAKKPLEPQAKRNFLANNSSFAPNFLFTAIDGSVLTRCLQSKIIAMWFQLSLKKIEAFVLTIIFL